MNTFSSNDARNNRKNISRYYANKSRKGTPSAVARVVITSKNSISCRDATNSRNTLAAGTQATAGTPSAERMPATIQ
jgi:hypothetical protein